FIKNGRKSEKINESSQRYFLGCPRCAKQENPKLREAIKTLKLIKLVPNLARSGVFTKANQDKTSYNNAYSTHISQVDNPKADFDINHLCRQIDEECIFQTQNTPNYWGNYNTREKDYCVTLINRIESIINASYMSCVFNPGSTKSIFKEIDEFLKNKKKNVLIVSLRYLSFEFNVREIIANSIGRYLLNLARVNKFKKKPLIIILDEAHQFLNKSLGDENNRYNLDQFELIAKEGRKYSFNICFATQRPRDIPEGIISQVGSMIVHRLINDEDRKVIERASGDIDKSASSFLPTLSPGQAIVVGVDLPMPIPIQIFEPYEKPDSLGPDYQKYWK
ncbi:MAG: ATP-binding protein, partial [Candidatus Lokiarchaeota archaeon]|nr:ATP-binding protein [Candidatus Lokiarchaeota archaeon]